MFYFIFILLMGNIKNEQSFEPNGKSDKLTIIKQAGIF